MVRREWPSWPPPPLLVVSLVHTKDHSHYYEIGDGDRLETYDFEPGTSVVWFYDMASLSNENSLFEIADTNHAAAPVAIYVQREIKEVRSNAHRCSP